jgi:hypothetical protein
VPINESLGTATLELRTDDKHFRQGLQQAERTTERIGKRMGKIGRRMSLAVTAPVALGFGKIISLASDLQESMNAVNVVFQDSADTIHEFAKTSVDAAGITQKEWNQAATMIGAQLQQAGMSMDAVAEKTNTVIQRAADMASIFNTDVNQALGAIQAALRGEIDPIERFGVAMNMASVEARALEEGIVGANEEMTAGQKVAARFAEVMAQTERYAGDFARTSDQLANKSKKLRSRLKQIGAEMGQALLPIMEKVVQWLDRLAQAFSMLSTDERKKILIFAAITAAIPPAIMAIGGLIRAFGIMGRAFSFVMRQMGRAGPWMVLATAIATLALIIIKNWDKIKEETKTLRKALGAYFVAMKDVLVNAAKVAAFSVAAFFLDKWQRIKQFTLDFLEWMRDQFKAIGTVIRAAVQWGLNRIALSFVSFFSKIGGYARDFAEKIGATMNPKNWFGGKDLRKMWNEGITSELSKGAEDTIKELEDKVGDASKDMGEAIGSMGGELSNAMEAEASEGVKRLLAKLDDAKLDLKDASKELIKQYIIAWGEGIEITDKTLEGLKDKFKNFFGPASDAFQGIKKFLEMIKGLQDDIARGQDRITRKLAATARTARATPQYTPNAGAHPFATSGSYAQGQWAAFKQMILAPIGNAFGKIGNVIRNAIPIFQALFQFMGRILSHFRIWDVFIEKLTTAFIQGLAPAVNALIYALTPLIAVVQWLFAIIGKALAPVFNMLRQVIINLIPVFEPIGKLLYYLGGLLQAIMPFLQIISKILATVLTPVLRVFAEAIRLVANIFIAVARAIIAVAQALGADVEKPEYIERLDESKIEELDIPEFPEAGDFDVPEIETPGTGGGTTAIRQQRPINVQIDIYDNELAGSDGFQELAQIIRSQFERMNVINV